jgi:hypothetical protein
VTDAGDAAADDGELSGAWGGVLACYCERDTATRDMEILMKSPGWKSMESCCRDVVASLGRTWSGALDAIVNEIQREVPQDGNGPRVMQ